MGPCSLHHELKEAVEEEQQSHHKCGQHHHGSDPEPQLQQWQFSAGLTSWAGHSPSVLKCKEFFFVLNQSISILTKFIEKNIDI